MRLLPPSLGGRSGPAEASPNIGAVKCTTLRQSQAHEDAATPAASRLQLDAHGPSLSSRLYERTGAHHLMAGPASRVAVRTLSVGDEDRWDAFVVATPEATFFHLSGWKQVIEQAFGHQTFYLMAERAGVLTGVLPLTFIKSWLLGPRLVGNAFVVHGGPVGLDGNSAEALEAAAVQLMEKLKVPVLELRSSAASRSSWATKDDLYATFRKPILPSIDENMKAIPRKQRAMVRKGISNGLKSELDEEVDRLHRLYSESVRNLGTPTFAPRYFRLLRAAFLSR